MTITATQENATRESARLSCRISPAIKRRAEEAAELLGQSMTDFTEAALSEKAQAVFEQHERIVLSERDFAAFVQAIQGEPEPPSQKLLAAVAQYKERHAGEKPGSNG